MTVIDLQSEALKTSKLAPQSEQLSPEAFYSQLDPVKYPVDDAVITVREVGNGPSLVFIHGFIVHGFTWRKILPTLSRHFHCIIVDLPGLGDSDWNTGTNFTFTAQAKRLSTLLENLYPQRLSIIAQDTGATIARLTALALKQRIDKLILINTEIPNHRPPWIGLYQKMSALPGYHTVFRACLTSNYYVQSPMGLGAFYSDKKLFKKTENIAPYIQPLLDSPKKLQGALLYLAGIEWKVVDELKSNHQKIESDVLLLWGQDDPTFPIERAEEMLDQFKGRTRLEAIEDASLMPHEEKPEDVVDHVLEFFWDKDFYTRSDKESLFQLSEGYQS